MFKDLSADQFLAHRMPPETLGAGRRIWTPPVLSCSSQVGKLRPKVRMRSAQGRLVTLQAKLQLCRTPQVKGEEDFLINGASTNSFIHSLMHAFIHSFMYTFLHSFACIHSFMYTCIHSFTHSFTHACIHSCTPSLIHSFALIHSFIHSIGNQPGRALPPCVGLWTKIST